MTSSGGGHLGPVAWPWLGRGSSDILVVRPGLRHGKEPPTMGSTVSRLDGEREEREREGREDMEAYQAAGMRVAGDRRCPIGGDEINPQPG
jgi:hypothetical protein